MSRTEDTPRKRTPLYDRHIAAGARMVPFAGYDMPVQYALGVLKEHLWTREQAGLFDVSHMGQAILVAEDGRHESVAAAIEALVPADIQGLAPGQQRYTQLLAEDGGILDDLIVTRPASPDHSGELVLVVNAARKDFDLAYISSRLPVGSRLEPLAENALLALQGPAAAAVIARHVEGATDLGFMRSRVLAIDGIHCLVSRSGYTGEDGFELAVAAADATHIWDMLSAHREVQPIGLGARDTLRLEAGLCLYGHDMDESTTPVEAALSWTIHKRRRDERNFPGWERIMSELREGPRRRRVGILPEGRAPAREGTEILSGDGQPIGEVTSGGFSPTMQVPIAMGYVDSRFAGAGSPLQLVVRGKALPARVVKLPFVPHRYVRT